ncbi:MAG: hypothetical protein O3C40_28580 [Planctomycetota bacterium]|nr:hypothetical protein [Planctomycetota bacterium]
MTDSTFQSVAEEVSAFEENCISAEMVAVCRQKTPAERLQIGCGMWRAARKLVEAGVRREHRDWSDDEVNREIASRLSHGLV